MLEDDKRGILIVDRLEECRNQLLNCQEVSLCWSREDVLPRIVFEESEELEDVMCFNTVNKIGVGWDRNVAVNSINFSFDMERKGMDARMRK